MDHVGDCVFRGREDGSPSPAQTDFGLAPSLTKLLGENRLFNGVSVPVNDMQTTGPTVHPTAVDV
jgi:hypothetical protein